MAAAQRNNWNVGNAEVSPHSHFAPLLGKHRAHAASAHRTRPRCKFQWGDCSSSPTESSDGDLHLCYLSGLMSGAFQQQELYLAAS